MEIPEKFAALGLTYDDVLLLPGESDLAPSDIDTTTRLTRGISIRVPLGQASTASVICPALCRCTGRPQVGQCGVPARANRRRR